MAVVDSTAVITPGSDYNTDVRPGLGSTFHDAEFDEDIKQLSAIGANSSADDMYAHCWANADGTMYFHNALGQLDVRRVSDGAVVTNGTNVPGNNFDTIWHPTNPDYYLYRSGTSLVCRSVSTASIVWQKNFGATLGSVGGSINWCDKTGRYFVVNYSSGGHVYDQVDDVIYTGTITSAFGAGYLGITPDGAYVVWTDSNDFYSQALDHGANTVAAAVLFMRGGNANVGAGSDHAVYVSASDGTNYAILGLSHENTNYYAVTINVNRAGMTGAQIITSILATGRLLLSATSTAEMEFHAAHGPNGQGQDWAFMCFETQNGDDNFNDATFTGWRRYEAEILAVNVLTGATRRLAHHRSRSVQLSYYYQPRPSCAWDGSLLIWTSNMNDQTPADYNDTFGIQSPLGAAQADPVVEGGAMRSRL